MASAINSTKTLYLIRHGTTHANELMAGSMPWGHKDFTDPEIHDTKLSVKGREDGLAVHHHLTASTRNTTKIKIDEKLDVPSFLNSVECVLVSPLSRTLDTMSLTLYGHTNHHSNQQSAQPSDKNIFETQNNNNIPIIANSELRERLYLLSDKGIPVEQLEVLHPHVDFSQVKEEGKPWWYEHDNAEEYIEWR